MTITETLTIDLAPDSASVVREAVSSGEYTDPSAVIDAALHGWKAQRDEFLGYSMEDLRRLGDEGSASGPGHLSLAEIQREALKRADTSNARA